MSINLYGAPALTLKEFADWEQDLIIGASLQVSAPWGQYDPSRIVNIGTNRWSFKPEIGMSKAVGPWTLEVQAAATFFTDNDDFYGGKTRSQDPLYSCRGTLIYGFRSGIWASVDATYFAGGRTTVNGVLNNDLQQNWRLGATLAFPVDRCEFDQVLRQQRRVGTHRQQLRSDRRRVAIPLGRRIVMGEHVIGMRADPAWMNRRCGRAFFRWRSATKYNHGTGSCRVRRRAARTASGGDADW